MKKNKSVTDGFLDFIITFGMSFLWVGYYGYNYNIALCNSPVINWFAFLLWGVWLMFTLRMYRFFYRIAEHLLLSLVLTWISYFFLLLFCEYIGYYVLHIRLLTNEGPLLLGVIHGKPVLKLFYMVAGLLAVLLSCLAKNILTAGQLFLPVNLCITYGDWRPTVDNHDNRERSAKAL